MKEKIFSEKHGMVLSGDNRDIMLPAQYKMAVLAWCRKNGITIENPLKKDQDCLAKDVFGVNLWRIRDEKQRMWFIMRWS